MEDSDSQSTGMTVQAEAEADVASRPAISTGTPHVRVAIVGTGFSGLGLAIRLKQRGCDDFVVLERAGTLGGTWRDNTYPGCACDVPASLYSFSFAPNPQWSRWYAPQTEIWSYLRACARRFGVEPHLRYHHEVHDATWDEARGCWCIATSAGTLTADVLALGAGPLSEPAIPLIPGLDHFAGTMFHSACWDHDHDLSGERVAVVGTGASAIQFVPQIQPRVGRLTLFQRTPPWIIPRGDRPISAHQQTLFRGLPLAQRLVRAGIYAEMELTALGLVYRPRMMEAGERLARRHLEAQVHDPALRVRLTPAYTMGCKRILRSDDFYPALLHGNVELVTTGIREVHPHGIETVDGVERPIDTLILATGFHVTDNPMAHRVQGRGGQTLAAAWSAGPRAYLGTTVAGFPNLFLLIGPNTGLGHTSMIYMIESQLAYILDCLRTMERRRLRSIEVQPAAQEDFVQMVQRRMSRTVWSSGCTSWYLDAAGRNTTLWPGFTWEYRLRTRRFDAARYHTVPRAATHRDVAAAAGTPEGALRL